MGKLTHVSKKLSVLVVGMFVLSTLGMVVASSANGEDVQRATVFAGGGKKKSPDLIVSDIEWVDAYGTQFTSGAVTAGQPFQARFTIYNAGLAAATNSFVVYMSVQGGLAWTTSIPYLDAGASYTLTWSGLVCTGQSSHLFTAIVDWVNSVAESNMQGTAESNNVRLEYLSTQLAEWTVAFYFDGDNNLEKYGIGDFLSLAGVGSSPSLSLVALMDRIGGYDSSYGNWSDCNLFFITQGMEPYEASAFSDWGEVDVSNPQTLIDFGNLAFERFGATKRALVLFDHGSLTGGVCSDWTSDHDTLRIQEVGFALDAISANIGGPIDLVGYDACLMGYTEVFYETRDAADYSVGSAHLEYAPGWPYFEIFSALRSSPAMAPRDLAALVVQEYEDYWSPPGTYPWPLDKHAMAAVDSSQIEALAAALTDFGNQLVAEFPDWGPVISVAKMSAVEYTYATANWGTDLYSFATLVGTMVSNSIVQSSAQNLTAAISTALVDYTFGIGYGTTDMRSLGILFPDHDYFLYTPEYVEYCELDISEEAGWDDFLELYYSRPYAPRNSAAEPGDRMVTLTWSGTYDGGYPISAYHIYRTTALGELTRIASVGNETFIWIDYNVTPCVTYYYRIAAANIIGTGTFAAEVSATPVGDVYLTIVVPAGCPYPTAGVYPYVPGETATVTAASYFVCGMWAYSFLAWFLDGQLYTGGNTATVLMDADHVLNAWYNITFIPP